MRSKKVVSVKKVISKAYNKSSIGEKGTHKNSNSIKKFQYEFLTSTSHQLRTPLATVHSSLDLLEMYVRQDNKARTIQTINKIRGSLGDITDTLDRITTLYKHEIKKQQPKIVELDPHKFFNGLLDEIIINSGSSRLINMHIDLSDNKMFADEFILKQILINILQNAIKFSSEDSQILVYVKSDKNNVEISVKDEGIGIDKKEMTKLFQPFFRGKNSTTFPGVGLGLTIVKKLSVIHKAKIKCYSELNKGTEFKIILPQNIR